MTHSDELKKEHPAVTKAREIGRKLAADPIFSSLKSDPTPSPVDGLEVVGHVKPEHPEAVEPVFVRELSQPWMEGIFTIPVVTLSQASSVIAGLKEEKTYWWEKAHEENGLRVHLEEENNRMREALEKIAQEQIQTNFGPWPTKGSEIARQALGDHNG